jgi:hypothetical protein
MRRLILTALLAVVVPCASAQRMIAPPHFSGAARPAGAPHLHRGYAPLGFFSDPLYYDALSTSASPSPSQPTVIMMQAAPPPPVPVQPPQPLMIVLDGDHYIRVGETETSRAQMLEPEAFQPSTMPSHPAPQATATPAIDPVTLIFRDGHREQVTDYTIADGILYSRADYFTDGSWNKKIALASLNLPETVETNLSHGVAFRLPTSPNEVIVRP